MTNDERAQRIYERLRWHESAGRIARFGYYERGGTIHIGANTPGFSNTIYANTYQDQQPISAKLGDGPVYTDAFWKAYAEAFERLDVWLLQKMNSYRREEDA